MISGEYAVLNGALSLAVPTHLGQSLTASVQPGHSGLKWVALRPDGSIWFEAFFDENGRSEAEKSDERIRTLGRLIERAAGPAVWKQSWTVQTKLDFEPEWGLGSSSTLVALLADWTGKDPFELFFENFDGSACDLAVALERSPILYRLDKGKPKWERVSICPPVEWLWLHYTGKKQRSSAEVKIYREQSIPSADILDEISALSKSFAHSSDAKIWAESMKKHENLLANLTSKTPYLLPNLTDSQIVTKSLGAWGGDFVLILSKNSPEPHFTPEIGSFTLPFLDWVKID